MVEVRQFVDCFGLVTWRVTGDNEVELVPCSCLCGSMYVMVACVWASANLRGSGSGCWRSIGRVGTESLWTCVSFSFSFSFLFPILPSVSSSFSILLSSVVVAKWIRCGAADVDRPAAGDPNG